MSRSSPFNRGSIEVICGCMFSGKTEELIRRIKHARIAGMNTALFKPETDVRYHRERIVSHNSNSLESTPIRYSKEILNHLEESTVVGIDEGQFFDEDIVDICKQLSSLNIRVIVAGLDMDFMGRPFGPVPSLLSIANVVTKLEAICHVCGNPATHTFRKSNSKLTLEIGESDLYEARCLSCFEDGTGQHLF